jgi:putative transposase
LIVDGTVVRVRIDKKSTSISLLIAFGVRQEGQKVLLVGGESEAAWRTLLDDLVKRGLRRQSSSSPMGLQALRRHWPGFGRRFWSNAARFTGIATFWPTRRTDMIYAATKQEVEAKRKAFIRKWAAEMPCSGRQLGRGRRQALHLYPISAKPMEIASDLECNRTIARGVQAPDQDSDPSAFSGNSSSGLCWLGQITMRKVDGWQSLSEKPSDPALDLAA